MYEEDRRRGGRRGGEEGGREGGRKGEKEYGMWEKPGRRLMVKEGEREKRKKNEMRENVEE